MTREPHVVSPYLQSIDREALPEFVAATGSESLRHQLERRIAEEDLSLLFDMLDPRLVAISRSDAEWLDRARADSTLVAPLADADFHRMVENRLLLPEADAFRRHAYKGVEVEINRHCNYRCVFCPVETAPKPKGLMSPEVYALVVRRIREYGAFMISLNHYSEPTLDPDLIERIRIAAAAGLIVRLHTNASLFDEKKIRALAEIGHTWLVVNLPSTDRAEFERVTGAKLFDRVIENLELLHRYQVPVTLAINSPRDGASDAVRAVNERFGEMFGPSVQWPTDSRGGRITKGEYVALAVRHQGLLGGCGMATIQLNVNWQGQAFLCCQDFDQEQILGDLREQSIREIAESDRAVQIRKWIFGHEKPPAKFLCTTCEWTEPLSSKRRQSTLAVGSPFKRDLLWPGGIASHLARSVPLEVA